MNSSLDKRSLPTCGFDEPQVCGLIVVLVGTPESEPNWFDFPITLRDDAPVSRDDPVQHLNDRKIATRLLFSANILRQFCAKDSNYRVVGELTNADIVTERGSWTGDFPGLGDGDLARAAEIVANFVNGQGA
jgi:CDP-6-deoxy-D-xylo-4-hexulose-3-dehydrase